MNTDVKYSNDSKETCTIGYSQRLSSIFNAPIGNWERFSLYLTCSANF